VTSTETPSVRQRVAGAALLAACLVLGTAPRAGGALTEASRLAGVYDLLLAAHFDRARARMGEVCPPAPSEACQALGVAARWWEIQQNPNDRRLDAQLERDAAAAIAASERWTAREPSRGEAWFYLAGSYGPLVQARVFRGERLSAARDAKKIKASLERALALDPTLTDAYFGIGLYHYYAGVAPAALKMLRWLLLLPGGDRAQGLREMLQARDGGVLLRGEADYQLHWIYLWYEQQPARALELLQSLDDRYPSNPVFLQRIAEVQHEYFHDHRASEQAWTRLVARERAGSALATRIGYAYLSLGSEYAHLGDRDRARNALDTAIALAPRDDPDDVIARARSQIKNF
jgi:tetratricopeptide (TPR) repeat protein